MLNVKQHGGSDAFSFKKKKKKLDYNLSIDSTNQNYQWSYIPMRSREQTIPTRDTTAVN